MTRVLLIHAGPTPWDLENRLTGAHNLPLTPDAVAAIRALVDAIVTPIDSIYLPKDSDACVQVADLLETKFSARVRNRPELDEMRLGLWEGLTREELRRRMPTIFPQWEDHPLTVTAPEGESLQAAIDRAGPAIAKILRRNRDDTTAIVLRPMMMQIVRGLLHHEPPEAIAAHLHNIDLMETMEVES